MQPSVSTLLLCSLSATAAVQAHSETVEIFAAGSLRGVVAELAREMARNYNIEVHPSFGGSGTMRERIEKGEKADLLLSADLGSPRRLQSLGRTTIPPVAFARNRMCIVSRRSAGVNASNLIDRMLKSDVRLKTSTPVADPAGDYAWAIFDRIEAMHPGAGMKLEAKAQISMNATATPAAPPERHSGSVRIKADRHVHYVLQRLPELGKGAARADESGSAAATRPAPGLRYGGSQQST